MEITSDTKGEGNTHKGDILIVDDNPVNLNLLSSMLTERNYRVRVATNGKRALSGASLSLPDLIMLDINMPEMDGYEVCRRLKADDKTRSIPVIFISALDEVMDKVKAFEVGGADYVTKPFQFGEVLARIENQLKISFLQKELETKNEELRLKNEALAKKNQELIQSREELIKSYEKADQIFSALTDILPGTLLDEKYRLEEKIGTGGFGVVYKAQHLGLNRDVAVKIFRPLSGDVTPEGLHRFRMEGISTCRINHPNAISILDSSISSTGIAYLVMELLEGHTLADELKEKKNLTPERCVEIIVPVCGALTAAHAAGVVHRDIKPDNIFLHQTKNGEVVKVVDFGIAKLLGEESSIDAQNLTMHGKVIGTPIYMSPERLNNLPYDGRADIYSLGIVIYKMLSGSLPYHLEKNDFWSIVYMHLAQEPIPLREQLDDIPEDVETVVMSALTKDPFKRPTANELSQNFLIALGRTPEEAEEATRLIAEKGCLSALDMPTSTFAVSEAEVEVKGWKRNHLTKDRQED